MWSSRRLTSAFFLICLFIYFFYSFSHYWLGVMTYLLYILDKGCSWLHPQSVMGGVMGSSAVGWAWTDFEIPVKVFFHIFISLLRDLIFLWFLLTICLSLKNLGYLPSPWILSFLPGSESPGHSTNNRPILFSSFILTIRTHIQIYTHTQKTHQSAITRSWLIHSM